ncbi:hypothetical protein EB796_002122 [Bugula neritina]|uniref:Ion transport domain-containing protein n=1 Tax=Bugula neritina TaxID=10212 RepID=A0A7J7KN23_BUGNE|nr:hypothetical protein EB796_002122 [Bugula neritina]
MDKVYKEYKRQLSAGTASFTESDVENGFPMSHTAIRVDEALTNKEKQYLVAVERGDMASTKHYLEMSEEDSLFNMNCRDPMGRSALLIAIEYENIEMMELLLSFNVEVRDALLHAINEENVEAVELLLKYKQTAPKHKNLQLFLGESQSDSFTPDITPLMLAAHRDNYEIIKILLERGDRIPKPHNVQCPCKDCAAYRTDDILCHSRTLAQLEPEFKSTYKNLSKQVQEFATELLDQTRGSEELETILNHDTESPMSEDDTEVMTLSRLRLAIKYKQKEFVAHPHCQQLLASIWYEGLPGFRRLHIAYRILMICTIGVLAPLWAILYILAPMSIFGKLMRKPFIKFIIHSASYIIFLFLLILTSQRIDFSPNSSNKGRKSEYRGATPNVIEWLITCWVIGRMVVDITKFGVIYFLVNFSFACGLNQLFWYYSMSRQLECEAKPELVRNSHNQQAKTMFYEVKYFIVISQDCLCFSLFEIMQTLYWALFGLVGLDTMTLKEDHSFTQLAGKTMFGVYSYISIIVLINMLIAMMNTSYQIISVVMRNLIKRYIMNKSRCKIEEGVTDDDVNEIKQDISSFRYELLEVLRNNGMDIPNYNRKNNKIGTKAFHRHKSTSQDLGDDEKSMELSTTNIDLPTCSEDSKSKSPGTPLMTDSTLDVSQCPSEEPLLPSKDKMADDRHSQRNKLFATSKHGALY